MKVVATADIQGPEASGSIELLDAGDGKRRLRVVDLHVVPGAPHVRLYVLPPNASKVREPGVLDLGKSSKKHLRVGRCGGGIGPSSARTVRRCRGGPPPYREVAGRARIRFALSRQNENRRDRSVTLGVR